MAKDAYYNSSRWVAAYGARVEYMVDRFDKGRILWRCTKHPECPFEFRVNSRGSAWRVSEFNSVHSCTLQLDHVDPSKIDYKVIATFITKKIRHECEILRPKAIMDELLYNYGLRVANPGCIVDLDVGEDGKFRYYFVALGAARLTYAYCLSHVIVVDRTHLKGNRRGILFVAVMKDADEGIYPLAYGVEPTENDESLTWFLSRVRSAYGCRAKIFIVSGTHNAIASAVKEVFPDATHALWYYHILKTLGRHGKFVGGLYQRAAYAYKHDSFMRRMASIREDEPTAYAKLMQSCD